MNVCELRFGFTAFAEVAGKTVFFLPIHLPKQRMDNKYHLTSNPNPTYNITADYSATGIGISYRVIWAGHIP
jgi:hypothetical protein